MKCPAVMNCSGNFMKCFPTNRFRYDLIKKNFVNKKKM